MNRMRGDFFLDMHDTSVTLSDGIPREMTPRRVLFIHTWDDMHPQPKSFVVLNELLFELPSFRVSEELLAFYSSRDCPVGWHPLGDQFGLFWWPPPWGASRWDTISGNPLCHLRHSWPCTWHFYQLLQDMQAASCFQHLLWNVFGKRHTAIETSVTPLRPTSEILMQKGQNEVGRRSLRLTHKCPPLAEKSLHPDKPETRKKFLNPEILPRGCFGVYFPGGEPVWRKVWTCFLCVENLRREKLGSKSKDLRYAHDCLALSRALNGIQNYFWHDYKIFWVESKIISDMTAKYFEWNPKFFLTWLQNILSRIAQNWQNCLKMTKIASKLAHNIFSIKQIA